MNTLDMNKYRISSYPVDDIFIKRWSPRAMSGETITKEELMSLFEAARWAPSSYNNQPWRFLYSLKYSKSWDTYFDLLVEGNKKWAKNAGALIVIVSKTTFDYNGKPSITHAFDTGAAWENLALQGSINNLVVHGMQGFDYDKAKILLRVPDGYMIQAMAAVGKHGDTRNLPGELREKDFPTGRKDIKDIAIEGSFQ